jgi:hypothetical protein
MKIYSSNPNGNGTNREDAKVDQPLHLLRHKLHATQRF